MTRWIVGGSSYLSSSDKRVLFGLGRFAKQGSVDAEILWPSGVVQTLKNVGLNRYHKIEERPSN
jgi:hypothetical protein